MTIKNLFLYFCANYEKRSNNTTPQNITLQNQNTSLGEQNHVNSRIRQRLLAQQIQGEMNNKIQTDQQKETWAEFVTKALNKCMDNNYQK